MELLFGEFHNRYILHEGLYSADR